MATDNPHRIRFAFILVVLACSSLTWAQPLVAPSAPGLTPADRLFFEELARGIEPDFQGDASRLEQYIRFFEHELVNDPRLFAFRVSASSASAAARTVRLSGFVEFPEHRRGVENLLRVLGFEIAANDIELLPDDGLGELRFGLLNVSSSLSFDQPSGDRNVVTECLIGEPLFLLKESESHFLCHSSDGYLGYVAAEDMVRVDEAQFAAYGAGNRVLVRATHNVGGRILPVGATLKLLRQTEAGYFAALPDGAEILLAPAHCIVQSTPTATIEEMVSAGKRFLGTRYHWGGKTKEGIDCSGLVQVAFQVAGLHLPRDSNQQIFLGSLTATRWSTSTMRRGDTMYFLGGRGRIRHTAIYLGDSLYLHAATPVVSIASLDPAHPDYDARRRASFAFAKRLTD